MSTRHSVLRPTVWVLYAVVVLEFLFMISPFALHFYSAYGGPLNLLTGSPATAWMTWFFLPHFSITTSSAVNALKPIGFLLTGLGLILFLVGAFQVYGAKLFRRGMVRGGLYRIVRHPQYLSLAVLGLGVSLIWPRYLVLVSFVTMMFLYYALARWEERDCRERFGSDYREYQSRTGMILPRLGRFSRREGAEPVGWRRGTLTYAVTLGIVLLAAGLGRSFSLTHVTGFFEDETAVLSPAVVSEDVLVQAYRLALESSEGAAIAAAESRLLVYVVPLGWFVPDLPLHTEEEIRATGGGHGTTSTTGHLYRVLLARPRLHNQEAQGRDIVLRAHGLEPLGVARVDLAARRLVGWDETPDHVIWGDIPTPLL